MTGCGESLREQLSSVKQMAGRDSTHFSITTGVTNGGIVLARLVGMWNLAQLACHLLPYQTCATKGQRTVHEIEINCSRKVSMLSSLPWSPSNYHNPAGGL
jgi:hypothetical protein